MPHIPAHVTWYKGKKGLCNICRLHQPSGWRQCQDCHRWCGAGCGAGCWLGDVVNKCRHCAPSSPHCSDDIREVQIFNNPGDIGEVKTQSSDALSVEVKAIALFKGPHEVEEGIFENEEELVERIRKFGDLVARCRDVQECDEVYRKLFREELRLVHRRR